MQAGTSGLWQPKTICTAPTLSLPVFLSPIQCPLHAALQADCSFPPSFLPLHPYIVGLGGGGGGTQPVSIRSAPMLPSRGHQVNTFLPTKFKPSQLQLTCVLYLKPLICSPNEHKKKLRYIRLAPQSACLQPLFSSSFFPSHPQKSILSPARGGNNTTHPQLFSDPLKRKGNK